MKKTIFPILGICSIVIVMILASKTLYTSPKAEEPISASPSLFEPSVSTTDYNAATSSVRLYAWGKNDDGQYGPANKSGATYPQDLISVAAGKSHTLILQKDGTVVSFGNNDEGQLGRPTTKAFDASPVHIPNLSDVIEIAAKGNYSLALTKDGTVWSWGSNFTGTLGTGDNTNRATPTLVNGLTGITAISAGNKFALAIKDDGTVWGWGAFCNEDNKNKALNLLNKVGSNLTQINGGYYDANSIGGTYDRGEDCLNENVIGIKSTSPRQLSSALTGAAEISVGYGHALILKKDGTVWSFGCNLYGQLGAKNFDNVKDNSQPRIVPLPSPIVSISAGFRNSLALTEKGEVYEWGISSAEDTKGNTFNSNTPVLRNSPHTIAYLYAGHDYSLAVDTSGKLWAWGMDNHNLFQSNEPTFYSIPKLVSSGPIYNDMITGGVAHIFAVTE